MHPTEPRVYSVAELRAWMDSQESSSEFDFVEAHVDSCKLCADVVDSLMRGLPVTEPHPLEIQSQARVKRIIGPGFDVEQRLGKGGSGEVWKCREHSLGRQVAIKFLNTGMLATGAELRRLRREAESLGRTDHPHVCRLYHVIERVEDNVLCLVMEYLGGGTLRDYLAQHQNISIREIVGVFTRLAEGVEHLHSLGLIHRDIKPANVLFSQNGVPNLRTWD